MNVRKAKRVAIATALLASFATFIIGGFALLIVNDERDIKAETAKYCAPDKLVHSFFIEGNHPPRAAVCQDGKGELRIVVEK
jgi:hypothetical protein